MNLYPMLNNHNVTSINLVNNKSVINTENISNNSKNFIEVSEINTKSIVDVKSKESQITNGPDSKGNRNNIEILDADIKK
jgi:hypothetical protein